MSRLTDRLARDYPGWRPEPGDIIEGTLDAIKTGEGDYGPYPLYELALDDGTGISLHAFHSVLRNELATARPGDRIAVQYVGLKPRKNGKPYESYKVALEQTPANSDQVALEHRAATLITNTFEEEPF